MEVLEVHVEVVLMEDHAEEDLVEDHVVVDMLEVHVEECLLHSDVVEVEEVAAVLLTAVSKLVVVVAAVIVVAADGQVAEPEVLRQNKKSTEGKIKHVMKSHYQHSGNAESINDKK